jgi:hypothetical protein
VSEVTKFLFSHDEAAHALGVSKRTITYLLQRGELSTKAHRCSGFDYAGEFAEIRQFGQLERRVLHDPKPDGLGCGALAGAHLGTLACRGIEKHGATMRQAR